MYRPKCPHRVRKLTDGRCSRIPSRSRSQRMWDGRGQHDRPEPVARTIWPGEGVAGVGGQPDRRSNLGSIQPDQVNFSIAVRDPQLILSWPGIGQSTLWKITTAGRVAVADHVPGDNIQRADEPPHAGPRMRLGRCSAAREQRWCSLAQTSVGHLPTIGRAGQTASNPTSRAARTSRYERSSAGRR